MRLLAAPPASLRFLRSAVPSERPNFAPWGKGRFAPGLGFDQRSPDRILSMETARSPRFLGNPEVRMPRSTTPVDLGVLPFGHLDVAFRGADSVGSTFLGDFGVESHGLRTSCLRFAATSRLVSAQDSVPVNGQFLPGRSGYLLGSEQGFQHSHSAILLDQAYPGATALPPQPGRRPGGSREWRPTG